MKRSYLRQRGTPLGSTFYVLYIWIATVYNDTVNIILYTYTQEKRLILYLNVSVAINSIIAIHFLLNVCVGSNKS